MERFIKKLGLITLFSALLLSSSQVASAQGNTNIEDAATAESNVRQSFVSPGGAYSSGLFGNPTFTTIIDYFVNGEYPSCAEVTRNNGTGIWECGAEMQSEGSMANFVPVKWYPGDRIACTFASQGLESQTSSLLLFGNRAFGRATDRAACVIKRGAASGNPGGFFFYYNRQSLNDGGAIFGEFDANDQVIQGSTGNRGTLENAAVEGVGSLAEDAVSGVARLIFTFSTWLLGIAGALFNWIIVKGVFQFSLLIGNSPGLLAAWGILRDLGNILLLFGFIFIGVSTILGTGKFGDRKAIPKLLIFAILMNFSLFAAEAVIDSANLLASTMYNQASETSESCVSGGASTAAEGDGSGDGGTKDCAYNYGISGHIIQSSGLASTFAADNPDLQPAIMVGLAAFVTVGAVLLFSASFMLITRAIVLTFLMITSPIGFAGLALPPMQKFAKQWWGKLIHQSFYAPILLLMIFISLKITDSFTSNMIGERNLAAALQNPLSANMGIILVFALVIGFMVASIGAAKKFGMTGADFALSAAKYPYKLAGRTALGTARGTGNWAARNTAGRAAASLQKKYNSSLANSKIDRAFFRGTGLDRAISGGLEAAKNKKYGGRSYADSEKQKKERTNELDQIKRKEEKDEKLKDAIKVGDQDKIAEILESMSTKEVEELGLMKKSGEDLEKIAQALTPEKFAALMKDGSGLTEKQKESAREARYKNVRKDIETLNDAGAPQQDKDAVKKRIQEYSAKDLENAPPELFNDRTFLDTLSDKQREDLLKGGKVTAAAKAGIKDAAPHQRFKREFMTANAANDVAAKTRALISFERLNPTQAAKTDIDILVNPDVAARISPKLLAALQKRESLTDTDAQRIKNAVMMYGDMRARNYLTTGTGADWWQ